MPLNTPEDAMPWVGLYVGVASLVCTLAMAADAFHGFRQGKLWFPCKFFTLNAASITVIAIAMKLPVDLTTIKRNSTTDLNVKICSVYFLTTMIANFLPSLGLMGDKELLFNIIALGILIITIFVNICIQIATDVFYLYNILFMLPLLLTFSVALVVPACRNILEHQYKESHNLTSNHENKTDKELVHNVKKYWIMAETGSIQFVIACSQVSSAIGVICLFLDLLSSGALVTQFFIIPSYFSYGHSDYKWSIKVIITVQVIGVLVGSIAPIFRSLTAISYFNLSKKGSINHVNVFRVEGHWTQKLRQWKHNHISSHIPGRRSKRVFHISKSMILNLCIALQIMVVVICKIICLIPKPFQISFACFWYICKSSLKRFKKEPNVSNNDVRSEMKEHTRYALHIEDEARVSDRILKNTLNSITRIIHASEEETSSNLLHLLQKSTGFNGVVDFDNNQVPPLHSEETQNSWSLVVVTLTTIVLALPNIANDHLVWLLSSITEGLQFVRHIEECLNENSDLVKARKASRRVWTEVEVYRTWLQIDLQKKARKGKTSKEILQGLGDEAVKIVISFKSYKKRSIDHSLDKFIVASSMYRISQTILLHCNKQENWPNDDELFEWIVNMIADILSACFTNLPRVITMKCHHDEIEKREESVRSAAELLGKSKKILEILKTRQLPDLELEPMGYINKWHVLPKSQIPNGCASPDRVQIVSSSSNESIIVTIM